MAKRTNILLEFWFFLRTEKNYWLAPLIIASLLLAGVVMLGMVGGGGAAPFIYALF